MLRYQARGTSEEHTRRSWIQNHFSGRFTEPEKDPTSGEKCGDTHGASQKRPHIGDFLLSLSHSRSCCGACFGVDGVMNCTQSEQESFPRIAEINESMKVTIILLINRTRWQSWSRPR
jgi:hypothetical protein